MTFSNQLQRAVQAHNALERESTVSFPSLARAASVLCDILLLSGRVGKRLPKLNLN